MISHDLFTIGIPISEKVIRTVAVYIGIAVLIRLGGKRDLAQLNSFDLVVILLLSNVVQNSIIGNDNSLLGGLLGATVLIAVNSFVVRTAGQNKHTAALFEGTPTILARDGRFDASALRREGLRRADLETTLRVQGAADVRQTDEVVLEPGGSVVVTLKPEHQTATKGDVEQIQAAIHRLEEQLTTLTRR
ncbi:MAG: hypothetical protein QOG53_3367 [Frankiales bacterium]|nr:hypothetical protein [Frankiales bacterium]